MFATYLYSKWFNKDTKKFLKKLFKSWVYRQKIIHLIKYKIYIVGVIIFVLWLKYKEIKF